MELIRAEGRYLEELKKLYLEAFPREERKPFHLMEDWVKEGKLEILAIVEDERFIGLDINMLAPGTELALLDYFAIASKLRGEGYGSRALKLILERFSGQQFIFEIEPEDETAENAEQRRRRRSFYLRNGLLPSGLFASLFQVPFELLSTKPGLHFSDYETVIGRTLGKTYMEMARPTLLRDMRDEKK